MSPTRRQPRHQRMKVKWSSPAGLTTLGIYAALLISCLSIVAVILAYGQLRSTSELSPRLLATAATALTLAIMAVGLVVIPVGAIIVYLRHVESRGRALRLSNIDGMTGIDFERYLRTLLTSKGFLVDLTPPSGDLGVDLVATKGGRRYAIQAKRHSEKVSRHAISDAVAGMQHYECDTAVVITNNYFTHGALALARSTHCLLVNRDRLAKWIDQFQKGTPAAL